MGWPYDLYHVFTICQVLVHRAMAAMTVAGPSCESWDRGTVSLEELNPEKSTMLIYLDEL